MIDPIREFWSWWAGCPTPDAAGVDRHVRAVDAGLGWEFSECTGRKRTLTVHADGKPTLRALAARWAAAAPASAGWEFLPARPPAPLPLSGVVVADGVGIDLSTLRFAAVPAPDRPEVDVSGVHDSFAWCSPGAARRVTELALADVLGEVRLDLWMGTITVSTTADAGQLSGVSTTADSRQLSGKALLRFVDDFASSERWRTWSRIGDASVRWPLRGARWPRFDTHLAVVRPSRALDRIVSGDCAVVAWEDGGRVAHVYADSASGAPALVEACAGQGAVIERGYDPTLAEVRHLVELYGLR